MTHTKALDRVTESGRAQGNSVNDNCIQFTSGKGITEDVVRMISQHKNEPSWMLDKRLKAYKRFCEMSIPSWGPNLAKLNLSEIVPFIVPRAQKNAHSWDDVPKDIKDTFEKLGIPKAERKVLGGVGAQYESQVVYHKLKEELQAQGVVFLNCDDAVHQYPKLMQKYFMTRCVPIGLHTFSALHAAVWSGGTFIYVPKGVTVTAPLQAYFRMNAQRGGQFEHTLIIVDEGAYVHYIEGCSAPQYTTHSLHAGCVEIHVMKGARARYSSIENWSKNTYNLNTKRAIVEEDGIIEWVNGNLGSGCTMLYPTSILKGDRSRCDYLGIALANTGQIQDTGAKVIHIGRSTSATITAKSIVKGGGTTSYRGMVSVHKNAEGTKVSVNCDTLMLDDQSQSHTYPYIDVATEEADVAHEATVGSINEEQLFYLTSRGIDKKTAAKMIVSGFVEPVVKELPLEYAIELNRFIEIEMDGSLG